MKKLNKSNTLTRTTIGDIAISGKTLRDEGLRLVFGAAPPGGGGGVGGGGGGGAVTNERTYPKSMTEPGHMDVDIDWHQD